MKYIRSDEEIQSIREACQIAASALKAMVDATGAGVTTYDLDQIGRKEIQSLGAESACYNYRSGANIFPAHTCISVNEEIVHGIGTIKRVVQPGDVVSLDVVVNYRGFIGDNATTVLVEPFADENAKLVAATRESLDYAITFARAGNRVGDISNAVERYIKRHNYGIVRDFVGHGVGKTMHEPPQIPNFGRRGSGALLKPGMALAIEPMINLGTGKVTVLDDGWTAVTRDGKPSAHFEHTVLVTNEDPEILTIPKN
ncbi:MAG TPA: type I methionyl aminopeptidase [Opitutales bacterium]|nr:type I methionyl aminopeptidase [Opitutales bacterium]